MTTLSTASINWLAGQWEDVYGSAVLSGIVGDLAHKARGGYHISRQDQGSSNYSVSRSDDKGGPNDRASAIDMTMSTADIIKCHTRLKTIWKNRSEDPRMKYINAWNGWDGEGDAGRYDVVTGNVATATSDHKWHIHLEIRRKYVNDMNAMKAILSMLKGETLETFKGEDDMTKEEMLELLRSAAGKDAIAVAVLGHDPGRDAEGRIKPGGVANPDSAGAAANPTISPSYALQRAIKVAMDMDKLRTSELPELKKELLATFNKDNVDETAIANALVSNTAFINSLASTISAKLPTGVKVTPEELTVAVKTALREGVTQ